MASALRRPAAQLLLVLAAASTFLTWDTEQSITGVNSDEGLVALIVAAVAVMLVRIRWRPAWIGAGLIVAISGRRLLTGLGDDVNVGIGLWVTASAALAATVLLVSDMFSTIDRSQTDSNGEP